MRRTTKLAGVAVAVATAAGLAPTVGFTHPMPSSQEPAATTSVSFQHLRSGATGPRVVRVQTALRSLGYTIAVDGRFGPETLSRVRAFQAARGLRVDGIVGPITWAALGLNGSAAPVAPAAPAAPAAGGSYVHPNATVEQWHDDALAAGWPESDWRRLSCIIQRESGGVARAKNPYSSALGLLQIMWSVHGSWIGGSSSQLYDGPTNLRVGRQVFTRAGGWSPWNSTINGC